MNRRWLTAAALFLVAGAASATTLPVKRYALFVGANQGGRTQQPLLYAQRDALKMQQVMQEVGGVGASDRILLLDPEPDDVTQSLADLAARMNLGDTASARRTEFLFYYSGHSDEDGLLLGDRSLTYKGLRDALQRVPADVRIAILDSCSSGAFARVKGGVPKAPFLGQEGSQMTGHAFLTSSSENEASQESDTLQGSFFTHYLVSGLRGGADRVGDGLITLNEAYEYAFQNTLARTESTRAGPQHPSYEIQLSGTGNLILSDVKAATARLDLTSEVAGKLYIRNPSGVLFAEVTKDGGTTMTLALPPGTYTVTVVTPKKSLAARVNVAVSSASRVSPQDFQEQDLARFAIRGPAPADPDPEDQSLKLNLSEFTLGLASDPEEGTGGDKIVTVSALVDFTNAVQGLQAAGLVSLNRGTITGIQAAGIGVLSQQGVTGLQAGGVFSIAGSGINGLQFGGFFNLAGGEESTFWQGAGVFNVSKGTARGLQTAGVVNVADQFTGVQVSVINVAGDMKGLQIGLININSHIEGAGLGLLSISPDAYYHPTLLWDQDGRTLGLFQWGMGSFYWLTGVVYDPKDPTLPAWETLGGAGVKFANRFVFWDTDGGWDSRLYQGNYQSGTPFLRTAIGLQSGWAAVEAGVMAIPTSSPSGFTVGPFSFQAHLSWFLGLRLF